MAAIIINHAPYLSPRDPDLMTYFNNVAASGGYLDAIERQANRDNIARLKACGAWSHIGYRLVFCGRDLTSCLVAQKPGSGLAVATNHNFLAADYSQGTGLTANGSTKYLQTGFIPSTMLTLDATHIQQYIRDSRHGTFSNVIGCVSGVNSFKMWVPETDGVWYSDQYNETPTTGGEASFSFAITPYGNCIAVRTSSTFHGLYQNGILKASNTGDGGALPAIECYVFARNNAGSPDKFSDHTLGSAGFGSDLTPQILSDFDACERIFQTQLGRNVF